MKCAFLSWLLLRDPLMLNTTQRAIPVSVSIPSTTLIGKPSQLHRYAVSPACFDVILYWI